MGMKKLIHIAKESRRVKKQIRKVAEIDGFFETDLRQPPVMASHLS